MIKFTTILKEYSDAVVKNVTARWMNEDSNVTPDLALKLIDLFDQKKQSLPSKLAILVLPDELKQNNKYLDITQYSYADMVRLLSSIPENPEQIKKSAVARFVKKENIDKPLAQSYTARFMNKRNELKQGIINGLEDADGNELFSKEQIIELIPKALLKNNLYYDPNNWKWGDFERVLDYLFPSQKQSTGEENEATTDADKVYDKDGIEIYKGDDVHKCISYNPTDPKTKLKKYSWCVTQPKNDNYDGYRFANDQPTFYFVFDRNKPSTGPKNNFDDKWHVFVVQVLADERGYKITSANNDRDAFVKTWEEVSSIVPADTWDKIKGLKDYFKPIALSAVERGRKLNSGRNLNANEFKELSQDEKILYVQGKASTEQGLTDDILAILPKYKINYGGGSKTLANIAIDSGQQYKYSQLKDNEALAKRYAIFRFRHTNYGSTPIPLPFIKYLDEPAKEKYLKAFDDYLTYEYIEKYFGPEITKKYVNDQLEKLEYLPANAIKYIDDPKKRQLFEAYSKLFSTWKMQNPTTSNLSDEQLENLKNIQTQQINPKPITEKEWKGMPDNDRSNILKVAKQVDGKEQYLTLLYALPYIIQDKTNSYVLLPKTSDTSENWVLADIKGNIVKDNISGENSELDSKSLDYNNGYMNMDSFKRIYNIDDLKINSSNNVNEEFRRMQQLAGIITEMPIIVNPLDARKAYGILFVDNDDEDEIEETPYIWNEKAVKALFKNMGYDKSEIEDLAGEFMGIFSPGDEDEMRIFRTQDDNPELQPTDLTIGMYKKNIEKEFPKDDLY
jgi:hypothetical protein